MSRRKSTPNLKKYRSLYAKAKRRGLVKGDKDARSIVPSAYMKTKLNKIAKYLTPEYTTVKPSKQAFKLYKQAPSKAVPFATMGRVVVKNEPNEIATVRKGFVTRLRRLKAGTYQKIILPITPQDLYHFEDLAKRHPEWTDILKFTTDDQRTSENFAFFFRGNPSEGRYGNLEQVADALINHYQRDIDPEDSGWFTNTGEEPDAPYVELYREFQDWDWKEYRVEKRKTRDRERNAITMRKMTPEQKRKRSESRAMARPYQPSYIAELERRKAQRQREKETGIVSAQRKKELEADRIRKREYRKRQAKKKK